MTKDKKFGGDLVKEASILEQAKANFKKSPTPNSGSSVWEDQSNEVKDYFIEQVVIIKQVGEKKDNALEGKAHLTIVLEGDSVGEHDFYKDFTDIYGEYKLRITSFHQNTYYNEKKDNGRVDKVK